MVTIIDRLSPRAQIAGRLGGGISSGLNALVDAKLNQIHKQKGLSALPGISQEQIEQLSYLPPDLLKSILPGIQKQQQFQRGLSVFGGQQQQGQPLQGDQPALERTVPTSEQAVANEEAQATQVGESVARSTGNIALGLKAKQDALKNLRAERLALDKKQSAITTAEQKRIAPGQAASLKEAKTLSESISSRRDSVNNYKEVKRLIDTGKVDLGPIYQAKSLLGLETSLSSPETQKVAKLLASEPLRTLKGVSGQAARLSKVFDQVYAMNGTLKNSKAGLQLIADTKILEAKGANIIDKAELKLREKYDAENKRVPFDLKEKAAKLPSVKKELNKLYSKAAKDVSISVLKREPEAKLSNFKPNDIIKITGTNEYYKKTKIGDKYYWSPEVTKEERDDLDKKLKG